MNVNCTRVTIWEIAIKEKNPIQNIPNKIVPSKQHIQNPYEEIIKPFQEHKRCQ